MFCQKDSGKGSCGGNCVQCVCVISQFSPTFCCFCPFWIVLLYFLNMANPLAKFFGNYPAEYNRSVHGPYDPSRFYGQADTPLAQVKLNELGSWLNRRNVHPLAIGQAMSRAYYRYLRRYAQPKYASPMIFFFQMVAACSTFFYLSHYHKALRHHKQYKYHW